MLKLCFFSLFLFFFLPLFQEMRKKRFARSLRLADSLRCKSSKHVGDGKQMLDWHNLGRQSGVCFNSLPSRVDLNFRPQHNDEVSSEF